VKLNAFLTINAIIAGVFGLGFVLFPGQVTSLYGPEINAPLEYMGQLFGATLLAFAVLTWVARNAPDSETRGAMLLALFVGDSVGFVVALMGQLGGVMNALGWSTVVIYLLLAIGFGYFRFAQPKAPVEHGQAM